MMMNTRLRFLVAALLPVLGLILMVARAEWTVRSGTLWQIPIVGYDPRDLLSGHYLVFRYDFENLRPASCLPGRTFSCCVCLRQGSLGRISPESTWTEDCADVKGTCESWINAEALDSLHRYYVPEAEAMRLQDAVRAKRAAIGLVVRRDGRAAVDGLYLDGQLWK
jgi:uncharacterized membrane-anchored protein